MATWKHTTTTQRKKKKNNKKNNNKNNNKNDDNNGNFIILNSITYTIIHLLSKGCTIGYATENLKSTTKYNKGKHLTKI